MVRRVARDLRINTLEAQRAQLKLLDKGLYDPDWIFRLNELFHTLGQQTDLGSVHAFNESLHRAGLTSCVALFYNALHVLTQPRPTSVIEMVQMLAPQQSFKEGTARIWGPCNRAHLSRYSLSDQQIWTLAGFLKHMDKLPPAVQLAWQQVKNWPVMSTNQTVEK